MARQLQGDRLLDGQPEAYISIAGATNEWEGST